MENTELKNIANKQQVGSNTKRKARPRNLTTLKLQWLAERVRKVRRIQNAIEAGTYAVDSQEVAKALLSSRRK